MDLTIFYVSSSLLISLDNLENVPYISPVLSSTGKCILYLTSGEDKKEL
jgi:hypothetical protein